MKKITLILVSIVLLAAMMLTPASAAEGSQTAVLSPATAAGNPGTTVTMTLSLSGFDNATSMTVQISGPTLDTANSKWLLGGTQSSFGGSNGDWTAGSEMSVNGNVATLAFTVPTPAAGDTKTDYSVSCTVTVKNGSEILGTVTANGVVRVNIPATGLSLSSSTLAMDMVSGTTASLTATVTPSNSTDQVSWSSSDPSVATVSSGQITALKAGTTTITAQAGSQSASCTVTVSCSHSLTEHKAAAATCQAAGNKLYYTCNVCNAVLDANQKATTVEAQTLSKLEHQYASDYSFDTNNHWHKCKNCDAVTGTEAHSFQWKVDKAATEEATGLKHEECACGCKRNENTVIPKQDHTHTGIKHYAAVPATCAKEGIVEYWTCSSAKCSGKHYGDAKCQIELSSIVAAVNADNHTGATEVKNKLEATCTKEGYSGDTYCAGCKKLLQKGEAVKATGKHIAKEGYLTDEKQHWQVCKDCGAVIDSTKKAHTLTWKEDTKATENAAGKKHEECTVCGYKTSENTVIEKLKHDPVLVSGKKASCTRNGVVEHFYCKNCESYYASVEGKIGTKITEADTILLAEGHVYGDEWVSDEKNHWQACTCGKTNGEAAHEFELVGAVEATDTESGYTGDEVCSVCGYVKTVGERIPCEGETEATEQTEQVKATRTTSSSERGIRAVLTGLIVFGIILLLVAIFLVILLIVVKHREEEE